MINRITQYFRDSFAELRKVTWPTRQQTIRYTILVVVLSALVMLYLALLDYGFSTLFTWIIQKF